MGRIQSEHIGYRFGLLEPRNRIHILDVFCECPHCQQRLDSNKLYISVVTTNRLQEAREYAKRWKCNSKAYKNTPDYVLFAEKHLKIFQKQGDKKQ